MRSYGPQRLRIYRMSPELGPPDLEEIAYPDDGPLVERRVGALRRGAAPARRALRRLADARYAWGCVEEAYAGGPYASMRAHAVR